MLNANRVAGPGLRRPMWEDAMTKRLTWLKALIICAAVLVGLSGCGQKRAPATTEELLVRYVANENVNNYKGKVNVSLNASALGISAKIPVTADVEAAGNTAHGTLTIDLGSLDTRNFQTEFYAELQDKNIECYLKAPGKKGEWRHWTIKMTSGIDIFTITDLLSASELTKMAKSTDEKVAFELTVPTAKVLETAFDLADEPCEVAGMDEQGMLDAVKTDKIRVDFDDDCLLHSATGNVLLEFKSAATNNFAVKIALEANAVFDDYGTVDPASVAIPDKVKNGAIDTDTPLEVIEVLGPDSPFAPVIPQ